ncbi:MAG: deoxynucleoside kinase [Alphaproteobacteria bacterium]|nr:deoxynucleoside kinase [Alphaproteobacteria bacterium]
MTNSGKIITISGLSACGKTTLLNMLREKYGVFVAPSASSLRDKSKTFNDISATLEENIEKQKYYFELDKKVSAIAKHAKEEGRIVLCDRDFLSALSHNYAVHQQSPDTSVYPWMVQAYTNAIKEGELIIPDKHIFLDVSIEERKRRKSSEPSRFRDNCFFEETFSGNMRDFYHGALQNIPSLWVKYDTMEEIDKIFEAVEQSKEENNASGHNLVNFLKGTIDDTRVNPYIGKYTGR